MSYLSVSGSENSALATSRIIFSVLFIFKFQDVVGLDHVEGAFPILPDKLNGIDWRHSLMHKSNRY